MYTPKILTLDIASKTGWAYGPAGDLKRSGSVNLRPKTDDPIKLAPINLGCFLIDFCVLEKPDVIVCEAALPVGATPGGNSTAIALECLGAVEFYAHVEGILVRYANISQVRSHYTGKARHYPPDDFKPNLKDKSDRARQWTKSVIVGRAHALGHMPMTSKDNDRADACAIFSYASEVWYKAIPKELHMLGEIA